MRLGSSLNTACLGHGTSGGRVALADDFSPTTKKLFRGYSGRQMSATLGVTTVSSGCSLERDLPGLADNGVISASSSSSSTFSSGDTGLGDFGREMK